MNKIFKLLIATTKNSKRCFKEVIPIVEHSIFEYIVQSKVFLDSYNLIKFSGKFSKNCFLQEKAGRICQISKIFIRYQAQ